MIDREPGLPGVEIPQEAKAQCEQKINEAAEKLLLPPTLLEALKPDKFLLHSTGYKPHDELYFNGVSEDILAFINDLLSKYQRVSHVTTSDPRQMSTSRHIGRLKLALGWDEENKQRWQKATRLYARHSVAGYELLSALLISDTINYYPEVQPDWDHNLGITDEKGELSQSRIAALLVEQGNRNTTQSKLDARFEHIIAIFQLCTIDAMLWQMNGLEATGSKNKQRKVTQVFEKWKQLLPEDNLYGKIELLNELADIVERFAESEQDAGLKNIYKDLRKGNQEAPKDLEGMLDYYIKAYKVLGYELPTLLALREQAGKAQTTNNNESDAPQSLADQAEVAQPPLEELEGLMRQLGLNVDAFNREWTLTGQKKKELKNLRGALVMGSGEVLPGVPKERAAELADVLARLHIFGTQEAGMHSLAEQLQYQTDLQAEMKDFLELLDEITPHKLTFQGITLRDIKGDIAHIKENWQAFKSLILENWPNYEGATAVHSIEQLLFASPTIEQPVPDKETEEPPATTIESLIVDGYIDEVVFPGSKGESDIEEYVKKTLRESKVSERQMRDLQWQRILDLDTIKELFGGKLYKTKPKERFLGTYAPYFVVIFEYNGSRYAVAESPIFGNATYVVAEKHAAATWLEILKTELRRDAKEFGAISVKHTTDAPYGDEHIQKVYETVTELDSRPT